MRVDVAIQSGALGSVAVTNPRRNVPILGAPFAQSRRHGDKQCIVGHRSRVRTSGESYLQWLRFFCSPSTGFELPVEWTSRGDGGGVHSCVTARFAEPTHSIADLIFRHHPSSKLIVRLRHSTEAERL